jgi:assimilatory nitrate reductase catalytic subunit
MSDAPATNPAATLTHCPYCALQCGMVLGIRCSRIPSVAEQSDGPRHLFPPGSPRSGGEQLGGDPARPAISGDRAFDVNQGELCVKGFSAAATLEHPDRLLTPLMRSVRGALEPASWEQAIERIASGLRSTAAVWGPDATGLYGSGALTNEKAYLLGKLARVALRTSNIDYNGRFCMSSAAAAGQRALGIDRGLPFPLSDVAEADVLLLVGSNVVDTMPPLTRYLEAQRKRGGHLVVIDPRRTSTARTASLHLQLAPGSDSALANGLMHLLVRERLIDEEYIAARTEGFEAVRAEVATYWPERVERVTSVSEARLVEAAQLLGRSGRVMVLTGRGPEHQAQGVNNALAYINLALALGMVGKRGAGYGCITGQGNGQGGREHGQKADQLPGYRRIDDAQARAHLARVWGVDEKALPGVGRSAAEMFRSLGEPDGVRALWVIGANPVVSAPDALQIERRMRSLDLLVVSDFFLSQTAALADVVLPAAQWAEETGTTTNLEGRVLLRRRAFAPPGEVRTDLEAICAVGQALGFGDKFGFGSASEVFDELSRATAGGLADYSGMSHRRLDEASGLYWPCPSGEHPGTPRLFEGCFPTASGRARFHAVRHVTPAEEPDAEFPLVLSTGRLAAHYQTGTQTHRVEVLERMAPRPVAQLHPRTAARHALRAGDEVELESRRGRARFVVDVSSSVREGDVFVPFHWGGDGCANRLTSVALDPISRMPEFKVCAVRARRSPAEGEASK